MNDKTLQQEIDEINFELSHELGLLERKHLEKRLKELEEELNEQK